MGVVNGLVLHHDGDRAASKLSASELPPEPEEISSTLLHSATMDQSDRDLPPNWKICVRSSSCSATRRIESTFITLASARA
jgi:hypothetical protein